MQFSVIGSLSWGKWDSDENKCRLVEKARDWESRRPGVHFLISKMYEISDDETALVNCKMPYTVR